MSTPKPAPSQADEAPIAEPVRTPENTPLPGGGRWVWDEQAQGWAEAPEPAPE